MLKGKNRYEPLGEFINTPFHEVLDRIIEWRDINRRSSMRSNYQIDSMDFARMQDDMMIAIDILAKMVKDLVSWVDAYEAEHPPSGQLES